MENAANATKLVIEDVKLDEVNADPMNWEWKDKNRALWMLATEPWPMFCNKWYGNPTSLIESRSLSLKPLDNKVDPSLTTSLFIRPLYLTMFKSVCSTAMLMRSDPEDEGGIIVTGQPGTRKTLFSYYLLVLLLQLCQVILYSPNGKDLYLFHHDGVYTPTGNNFAWLTAGNSLKNSLPHPISPKSLLRGFIWSLFDICEPKEPVRELLDPPCFPIQTTSPDPIRYKTWQKEYVPFDTGMPLWSQDELAQGLQCRHTFPSLLNALSVYASPGSNAVDPLIKYPGTRTILEDRFGAGGFSQPLPEGALDCLLDAVIEHFGYSARDVFHAVFNFDAITKRHKDALKGLTYSKLQDAMSAMQNDGCTIYAMSHCIVAISPIHQENPLENVCWKVDFKSEWVARNMVQKLGEAEALAICQQVNFLRCIPEARAFAGRLLEPLFHCRLADTTDTLLSPAAMKSNHADPPNFTFVPADPSSPDDIQFPQVKRKIVNVQSIDSLSCLENNGYYIPTDPTFPLFDTFIVELDHDEKSAVLWVIQVTTSRRHRGSSSGYQKVRQIVGILKTELQGEPELKKIKVSDGQAVPAPSVEVQYLLVVPKGELQTENWTWKFPPEWNENRKKHDHCGKVYCMEVPVA